MKLAGRKRELDRLVCLIADIPTGVIHVTGSPGVGKSALLGTALPVLATREPAVWHVDLRGADRGAPLVDEIARALGLWPTLDDTQRASGALAGVVAASRVVLAADHVDGLDDSASELREVLACCPRLVVVLVSRRAADPDGDRGLEVAPLEVPSEDTSPTAMLDAASVRLFIQRAQSIGAHLVLDADGVAAIGEICRLTGGLPLAIELAAARARLLSLEKLAHELGSRPGEPADLDLLEGAGAGIRENLRVTRDLLTPAQDRLLVHLATFHGRFPLGAATAIVPAPLGEVLDSLGRLIDLRLVEVHQGRPEPTLALLPIVRSFVHEFAEGMPEPVLPDYLRQLAEEASAARARLTPSDAVDRVRVLRRDYAIELRRLASLDAADACSLAVQVASSLEGFEEDATIGEILETALAVGAVDRLEDETRAAAWVWSARMLALSPDGVQHSELIAHRWARGTALIDPEANPLLALQARMIAVQNGTTTGDFELSARAATEGLRIARSAALPAWAARLELSLAGAVHHTQGPEAAVALARASLDRAQRIGDASSIAWAITVLNTLPAAQTRQAPMIPDLEDAVSLADRLGDPVLLSFVYAAMTMQEQRAGRTGSAAHWCARRLELARRRGWWTLSGMSLIHTVLIADSFRSDPDADVVAARLMGVIRLDVDRLLRSMAPSTRALFGDAVTGVHARLGDLRYASAVAEGGMLSTAGAATVATEWLHRHAVEAVAAAPHASGLSAREREVLQLLATGLTNKEIAQRLHLSVKTVMHHSVSIYRKLAVRGRAEATAAAYRNGLITLDAAETGGSASTSLRSPISRAAAPAPRGSTRRRR
ncbi:LuxR C-terminal-related transcriptional regulator [Microbacterium sp. CPCC 204701]|uniref:LuxR C-terminal-related transcriptional regulator n=1 Tax=Microbacterium sp. CPCC 204701 TaxID=2493084 RepID=UPI00237A4BCF|nr:LuxR C-terminal-related transcriptional regulator [Microbacterium sp. CPCC 204701]